MRCIAQLSTEDAEIRMGEPADVWKDSRQIRSADAEPRCERGGKLVDGSRGNPAALTGIVGTVDSESRERAEQTSALDCATEHKLVTPPPVIGTGTIGRIGPTKIGRGKSGDLGGYAELDRCVVKRA